MLEKTGLLYVNSGPIFSPGEKAYSISSLDLDSGVLSARDRDGGITAS
jgi:hypothetical protein